MQVAGIQAIYHKLVFEVRYDHGLLYLDRCGATANRIMSTIPDWILNEDSVSPQNAPLINVSSGVQFNFNALKFDFSLDQPKNTEAALTVKDIGTFVSQVDSVARVVQEELELRSFIREGFRIWYIFPTESEEGSQKLISSFKALRVDSLLPQAFSGTLESQGYAIVISGADRKFRVSINAVERLEQLDLGTQALTVLPRKLPRGQREAMLAHLKSKRRILSNPHFAVMIDVDAYVDRPIEIAPADFIDQSLATIEKALPSAFVQG